MYNTNAILFGNLKWQMNEPFLKQMPLLFHSVHVQSRTRHDALFCFSRLPTARQPTGRNDKSLKYDTDMKTPITTGETTPIDHGGNISQNFYASSSSACKERSVLRRLG